MKIAGKLLWVQGIPFYFQNGTLIGWVPFGKNYIGVGLFCYSNSCGWSAGAGAGGTPVERVPYSKIVYNIHYTIVHLVETKRVSLAIKLQAARLIAKHWADVIWAADNWSLLRTTSCIMIHWFVDNKRVTG